MAQDTILQTSGSVSTILGILNQFHAFIDLPYTPNSSTTLNSKYGVLTNVTAPPTIPLMQYYGIGICGYQNIDDQQGAIRITPLATNMDLYGPIPLRCVPKADESLYDFSKYRMRREITIGATAYVCYYLKKIKFEPNNVSMVQRDPSGAETPYVLSYESFLTPTPPTPAVGGETNLNANRVVVRATGICEVTGHEVNEVVSALYGGEARYARISELGIYTGCEVFVDSNNNYLPGASSGARVEAAYVQLAKHRTNLGSDLHEPDSVILPYVSLEASAVIEM